MIVDISVLPLPVGLPPSSLSHISCTQSCDSTSDSVGCLFVLWFFPLFAQGGGLEMHTET